MVQKKKTAIVRSGRVPTPGATADGRNAYRKMIREQRETFLQWAHDEDPETWRRTYGGIMTRDDSWVTR